MVKSWKNLFQKAAVLAAFFLFAAGLGLVSAQITTNLAALFHFDQNATDASGNNNNGTVQGATFVVGKFNKGLSFDGVNDTVQVTDSSSLDISQTISLAAWVNPRSIVASTAQDRVIAKASSYDLMLSTNDTGCLAGGTGDVVFRLYFTDGTNRRVCGGSLPLNTWSHIAATYNGSQMKVFVNGALKTTFNQTGTIVTNSQNLFIGNTRALDRPYDGLMDEAVVWRRALTDAEVLEVYQSGPISQVNPTPIPPPASEEVWPTNRWPTATPAEMGMDEAKLKQARDFAVSQGGGSGFITRGGKRVMSWGSSSQRYDLKSTGKSIGISALGLAIKDGLMNLSDQAQQHHPSIGVPPNSNKSTGWLDNITILHLATQTAGFDQPGGYTPLLFQPGTKWFYSDGGPNWLGEAITLQYQQDLNTVMFDRVFSPLGIDTSDLTWRSNIYRPDKINGIKRRELDGGISANVDAMARIGYLYLRNGRWKDQQIIPQSFVQTASNPIPEIQGLPSHNPSLSYNAPNHYGLLWWNNADGTIAKLPRDAYWAWGLYESLILVIPSEDIVVARTGGGFQSGFNGNYKILEPFFVPIAESVMR